MSADDICSNLQLVYDDRPSLEQGYRFVYLDSKTFATQSIPKIVGPALNFFEEIKKSHRAAKFYNAAPITTDIAVAQIPFEAAESFDKQSCGLKALTRGSLEEQYFKKFVSQVGDVRSLFFLRACMGYLPSFKALVNDKSIDSSLVWLPRLTRDVQPLQELLLLSFCHSVSSTKFETLNLKHGKFQWMAEDYFAPLGWLKSSGLMKSVYEEFSKVADSQVKKVCKESISARLERKEFDCSTLLSLAEERFGEAGLLPAVQKRKAG
jgi:hypothetical protein